MTQQFALLSVDNPMALTLEQATAKQGHKGKYVDYIRTSRATRVQATKMRSHERTDPTDPTSLGLDKHSGMHGPVPKLPDPREPLWLDVKEQGKEAGAYTRPLLSSS